MTSRRTAQLALTLVVMASAACISSTAPAPVNYGYLTVVAQQSGAGYVASTVGSFFSATGISAGTTFTPWDSCQAQNYSPTSSVGLGELYPSVSAGSFIQVKLGARTDSIFPVIAGNAMEYHLRAGGIPYTPGDTIAIVVPGTAADFPAVTLKAKTAEAFVMENFATPVAGANIDLRWNAAQDQNAVMVVTFRFAFASDAQNAQIYCQFKDDGTGTIPAKYATDWATSTNRSWMASRIRSSVTSVARGGTFNIISAFDLPTPAAP